MKRTSFVLAIAILSHGKVVGQLTDTLFMQAAIQKLQNAKAYTMGVATLMPAENYLYRPTAKEMGFHEQLLHLSQNLGWLCSAYLKGEENPVGKAQMLLQEKDSIIKVLDGVYDYALSALRQSIAHQLSDSVKFFAGPMTRLQIVNLINDHQTHHRAQLVVYLRLNGIEPPRYVGW